MDIENDYWFTIEPYVFINIANNCALLYNTYDGKILISKKAKVIELLNTFLQKSIYKSKNRKRFSHGTVWQAIQRA